MSYLHHDVAGDIHSRTNYGYLSDQDNSIEDEEEYMMSDEEYEDHGDHEDGQYPEEDSEGEECCEDADDNPDNGYKHELKGDRDRKHDAYFDDKFYVAQESHMNYASLTTVMTQRVIRDGNSVDHHGTDTYTAHSMSIVPVSPVQVNFKAPSQVPHFSRKG